MQSTRSKCFASRRGESEKRQCVGLLTACTGLFPPLPDLQLHAIPLAAVVRPALAWRWIEPAHSDAPLQPVALSSFIGGAVG